MLQDPLEDAIWLALTTSHEALATTYGAARRYPGDVAPFAAVARNDAAAMRDLRELLEPGESVFVLAREPISVDGLEHTAVVPCLQMVFPAATPLPKPNPEVLIEPLTCADADEMMELTQLALPEFFRTQTCRMGDYFGVRDGGGTLIGMGGERLVLESPCEKPRREQFYRELSGICTHPAHTGKGLGTAVLGRVVEHQRACGAVPFLHVSLSNRRAMALYLRLGFEVLGRVDLHKVMRSARNG